jgi:hypothetical protein
MEWSHMKSSDIVRGVVVVVGRPAGAKRRRPPTARSEGSR